MKKISKFASAIALAITIHLGNNISIIETGASVVTLESEKNEYITSVVHDYIESTNEDCSKDIYISQPYYFYDFKNGTSSGEEYVVFLEDDIAGLMYVNIVNGEYSSSYRQPDGNFIDDVLLSDKKIAFGYSDGKALVYCEGNYYDTNSNSIFETDMTISDEVVLSSLEKNLIENESDISSYSLSSNVSYSLNVVPVSNEVINNVGTCWCSSIASKHNYKYNKTANSSGYVVGHDVYNIVSGITGITYPTGTESNTKIGLSALGLVNSFKPSSMNINEVEYQLSNNNPVIISVSGTAGAHSLVISGMTYNGSTGTYTMVDSNFQSPLTVSVSAAAATNGAYFAYTSDVITAAYGGDFDNWYQTYSYIS
ncbi:MAG: papain-like cysteine protease family protein [Oscillospiraceae bacterium]